MDYSRIVPVRIYQDLEINELSPLVFILHDNRVQSKSTHV